MLAVGGFSGVVLLVVHLVVYLAGKTWQKGDKKKGKRRGKGGEDVICMDLYYCLSIV